MKMSKLKRQAEILSKECGLPHSKALELAARLNGFKDLHQAQKAACASADKAALDTIRQASMESDQLEPETKIAKKAIEGSAFPKMKVFASRFPDQGVCGGGMVVVAGNYELAKELLRKDLAQDQDQDWHEEILEALEELGPASNAVYSFFT